MSAAFHESRVTKHQRLFFALWPNDTCRAALECIARRHLPRKSGRLVPGPNLHITLAFLGSTSVDMQERAERVADTVVASPFTLELARIGHWPRPRVMWCAPAETPAELLTLAAALHEGLRNAGFELERRAFQPHLTLARKVSRRLEPSRHEPFPWRVDAFHLVASETRREGARYRSIRTWDLHRG